MAFPDLFKVIGLLIKERKIQMHLSPTSTSEKIYRSRKEYLNSRFRILVDKHFTHERGIDFFASLLCITPKYLSSVVKQTSGKTPNYWISETIIREVKKQLLNSTKSIKEIAHTLNFRDNSSLGKYFKKHTGLSPSFYRTSHNIQ